jgi:hypothetical protein
MTILSPISRPAVAADETLAALAAVKAELAAGHIIPYLGPSLFAQDSAAIPTTPEALALALHAKAAVSGRIRGNLWATAQFIESRRHRKTLTALMMEIFRAPVAPTAFHRRLADWRLPLIVDTWYDGAMRAALQESGRTDWGELQGVTRAGEFREIWTRAYDASGAQVDAAAAASWTTILYKPHGAITPAANFLVSDSDYVEVLTEIDIQTPIPDIVKERRQKSAFLFIGARFHDQMLRIFARQIAKRSAGGHRAIAKRASLTRNEVRFLDEVGIELIDCPLDAAAEFFFCG